ncbi:MAG: hypothetical protein LIP06_14505 [Tannerellaceae bacterium]|nr:hypothetical protein [Tannerellaceae bacterium]
MEKLESILLVLAAKFWALIIVIIIIIGIIRAAMDDTDPLDRYSRDAKREVVADVEVVDSRNNGFMIKYVTQSRVTEERLAEIKSRPHIKAGFKILKEDAVRHFNDDMLYTDIYDFALFVREYEIDKSIMIHNIFISGADKYQLYLAPNPNIPRSATWVNYRNYQGMQYITDRDIYRPNITDSTKIYRYWECEGLNAFSYTDERFSHFSEDERIF